MAVLDDLGVGHELAGPLDGADADEQQGQPEEQAHRQVGGTEAQDDVGLVADLEDEVGDAEGQRAQGREPEEERDLALGTLLGALVDVGGTGEVRGETGVGDRVGLDPGELVLVAHAAPFFFVERVEWAAIQTANPTSPPIPMSQAARPSVTGPSEPSWKPP